MTAQPGPRRRARRGPRSRPSAASTASAASTPRRSATRGWRSSSSPASLGAFLPRGAAAFGQAYSTAESRGRPREPRPQPAAGHGRHLRQPVPRTSGRSAVRSPGRPAARSPSWPASGRSSPCPGRSRPRPAGAASSSSPPRRSARRRIALEKLAAHLTVMAVATAVIFAAAWLGGAAFGVAPRRRDPAGRGRRLRPLARAHGARLGRGRLRPGAVHRPSRSAGIAGAILVGGYVINGYQASVPAFRAPRTSPGSAGPSTTCRSPASTTGRRSCRSPSSRSSSSRSASRRSPGATSGRRAGSRRRASPGVPRPRRPGRPVVRRAAADGARLGHRARPLRRSSWVAAAQSLHERARQARRRAPYRLLEAIFPNIDLTDAGGVPPARVRRASASSSPGSRPRRSSPAGPPTRRSGRLEVAPATPTGAVALGRRRRSRGVARDRDHRPAILALGVRLGVLVGGRGDVLTPVARDGRPWASTRRPWPASASPSAASSGPRSPPRSSPRSSS